MKGEPAKMLLWHMIKTIKKLEGSKFTKYSVPFKSSNTQVWKVWLFNSHVRRFEKKKFELFKSIGRKIKFNHSQHLTHHFIEIRGS
jgi:hypothetical protein